MTAKPAPQTKLGSGFLQHFHEEMAMFDIGDSPFAPTRVKDKGDFVVGDLRDYPELQRLFLIREHRRGIVDELVSKVEDEKTTHDGDHIQHGHDIDPSLCSAYVAKVTGILREVKQPLEEFRYADRQLRADIHAEFGTPEGRKVVGFRKDYQIVLRNDDRRGDEADPFDRLKDISSGGVQVVSLLDLLDFNDLTGFPGFGAENPYFPGGGGNVLETLLSVLRGARSGRKPESQPAAPTKPGGENNGK